MRCAASDTTWCLARHRFSLCPRRDRSTTYAHGCPSAATIRFRPCESHSRMHASPGNHSSRMHCTFPGRLRQWKQATQCSADVPPRIRAARNRQPPHHAPHPVRTRLTGRDRPQKRRAPQAAPATARLCRCATIEIIHPRRTKRTRVRIQPLAAQRQVAIRL